MRPLNKDDIFNWRGKKAGTELKVVARKEAPLQHLSGKPSASDSIPVDRPKSPLAAPPVPRRSGADTLKAPALPADSAGLAAPADSAAAAVAPAAVTQPAQAEAAGADGGEGNREGDKAGVTAAPAAATRPEDGAGAGEGGA